MTMKMGICGLCLAATAACAGSTNDNFSDTWVAADGLGRPVATAEQAGPPRPDRFVAMFYFLWHEGGRPGPFDVSRIRAADPAAMQKPTSPPWGPLHAFHYWGEPLFGYYLDDDPWVIRKHAQLLADAGVDAVIFDASNRYTYRHNYLSLMEVFRQLRREGNRTPQIAFLAPFGDCASTVQELFDQLYAPGQFEELWFRWEGKPLILADPAHVHPGPQAFFTFRTPQPDYFRGQTGPDMWSWLEVFPQHVFTNAAGGREQMSVGVAQNAVGSRLGSMSEPGSRGRSFSGGRTVADAEAQGLNFAEQWERALKEDPKLVFVTGWNEWIAMRFDEFNGVRQPPLFVDAFDLEHSRDIEPMQGGHGDAYYYQFAGFVRRFKGARPAPVAGPAKTIRLDGPWAQWEDVQPAYVDDAGDTAHRAHPGWGTAGPYTNRTGRNDFVLLKIARDERNLYAYARTREPVTAAEGADWMTLWINAGAATGWAGYDFAVNRRRDAGGRALIERLAADAKGQPVGEAALRVEGCALMLAIPRAALGLAENARPLRFEFKWADGFRDAGDIDAFTLNGDAAPDGRFNYLFHEAK